MISADVKADVKQQKIKEMYLTIFTRITFKTWNKIQNRCVYCIKFWSFHPTWYYWLRTRWVGAFLFNKQTKSVKRDESFLLTGPKQIILQTNRLSNLSSAYIAKYSLNLLQSSRMSNVCKFHKHYQNIMFDSMFNIFLVYK